MWISSPLPGVTAVDWEGLGTEPQIPSFASLTLDLFLAP